MHFRSSSWLLVVSLALGCAPRAEPGEVDASADPEACARSVSAFLIETDSLRHVIDRLRGSP